MYEKGDFVHQITNGLCRVDGVTTLDVIGVDKERLYYRLIPVGSHGSTVFIPVEKAEKTIRYAMTREEAKTLISEMPSIENLWVPDERKREQSYRDALRSMDYRSWVKIIKTLYLRKMDRKAHGKKTTSTDDEYLRRVENSLYEELAFALDMRKEEMEDYIIEQLSDRKKEKDREMSSPVSL